MHLRFNMSKYKLGTSTKDSLSLWRDIVLESKQLENKKEKKIDLYRIELTNGEDLLCTDYYENDCPGEYRLEVIAPEIFTYDVCKEEIKKVTKYTGCYIIAASDSFVKEVSNKIETTFKGIKEE